MAKAVKTLAVLVVATVLLGSGFACNTTEGAGKEAVAVSMPVTAEMDKRNLPYAGKDIKSAGEGIQNAADRNK